MDRNSKEINRAKLNSRISVEVELCLRLPNQPYVPQCTCNLAVTTFKKDFVLPARCCLCIVIRSIVTCCDVPLHTFSTDKAQQTYWQ